LRSVLLAAQVAISVVLLAAAGLMVRGLQRAQLQDPGFRINSVSIATLDLPAAAYSGARARLFASQLQETLSQAEGLSAYAVISDAPMARSRSFTTMRVTGQPEGSEKIVQFHEVTGGYFDVLGIPIVAGRSFTRDDSGRKVAMLNQTAARRFFGRENPVGKTIESNRKTWEIVGVAKDAYITDLAEIQPAMYWPMMGGFGVPELLTANASPDTVQRITAMVTRLEPKARVTFKPLADNLASQLEPSRYAAMIAGALGLLALGLASIGMAGVFAYMVRQRTREIGVRMALGARPAQVVRLVLGSNLRALEWGLAVGLAGAFGSTRLLANMMYGVSPFDPLAYAGMFVLLVGAAALASALPARRAARVDPVTALRWE
jgi:predicted permease